MKIEDLGPKYLPTIKSESGLRAPRVEDWDVIFEKYADNMSLKEICAEMGIHLRTVQYRIRESEDLTRAYLIAGAERGDLLVEKSLIIADGVVEGTICEKRGKVGISAYQWAAGQLNAPRWGQASLKAEVSHTGKAVEQVVIFSLPDNQRSTPSPMLNVSPKKDGE